MADGHTIPKCFHKEKEKKPQPSNCIYIRQISANNLNTFDVILKAEIGKASLSQLMFFTCLNIAI